MRTIRKSSSETSFEGEEERERRQHDVCFLHPATTLSDSPQRTCARAAHASGGAKGGQTAEAVFLPPQRAVGLSLATASLIRVPSLFRHCVLQVAYRHYLSQPNRA